MQSGLRHVTDFAPERARRRAIGMLVAGVALSLLAACDNGSGKVAAKAPDAVRLFETPVTARQLVVPVIGTGTVIADKTTVLGPRVTGIIDEVFVRVGDRVKRDAPLFHTRDIELKLRVAELEGQVRLARAELQKMSRAFGRSSELHGSGFVSNGGLDNARAGNETAAARLAIAQAQLAAARQQLADCTVRAPFDGVITRRSVDEGKYMMTMGGFGGGDGVIEIMKIDTVTAIVQIPEIEMSKVPVGTKGRVTIDGVGRSFDSTASIVNDAVNTSTRAVEVRLPILNADYSVKPGLFARAELYPEPRGVLSLNRSAVQGADDRRYVFVADGGTARRVPVTVRQIDAETVEVLSGLGEGQLALTGPNLPLLTEGAAVKIETAAADARPANTTP
jgi:RND family efflux transporter MFP subunit